MYIPPGRAAGDERIAGRCHQSPGVHRPLALDVLGPVVRLKRGHTVCNLNSPDVYLVSRTATYWDEINNQHIYERWEPWVFHSFDRENKGRNLNLHEPLLAGNGFANNDFVNAAITRVELYDRISKAMGVFAEKTWTGAKNTNKIDYAE